MSDRNGSVALVTGASKGLGRALARALAAEGWDLILDARGAELGDVEGELKSHTRVVGLRGDVTDPAHREEIAAAAQSLGGLDLVINNAGTLGASPLPPLLEYPLDELERVFQANVIAPLGILQAVRPVLKPGARIINVTSDAAVEPYEGWGGYGASKAALEQLSNVLAAENPEVRVYWVDPGDMRTDMHQAAYPGEDISDRPLPEESVPGFVDLFYGRLSSGRYVASQLISAPA
jgi:NAD(P)-dependent dehydrogenase (short-subunit alcohol dehydrogenase family)